MIELSSSEMKAAGLEFDWFGEFPCGPPSCVCSLNDADTGQGLHFTMGKKWPEGLPPEARLLAPVEFEDSVGENVVRVNAPKYEIARLTSFVAALRSRSMEFQTVGGAHLGTSLDVPTGVSIAPGAVVEDGVELAPDCVVDSGAVLRAGTRLGCGCRVMANAVVGSDGFGYGWPVPSGPPELIAHLGGVVLEQGVVVGPGSIVCSGTFDPTVVGEFCKLDGHVYIGHNARLGREVMVCAGSVVGGSDRLGDRVWVGTGCKLKHKICIGDDATLGVGSVVMRDVPVKGTVMGDVAGEIRHRLRRDATLDAMIRQHRQKP